MGLIELDAGSSRRYEVGGGIVTALDDASLTIGAGEFVVVLGPSGSGKTTLLNLIGALDSPTSGTDRDRRQAHLGRRAAPSCSGSGARRSASSSRRSTCSRV